MVATVVAAIQGGSQRKLSEIYERDVTVIRAVSNLFEMVRPRASPPSSSHKSEMEQPRWKPIASVIGKYVLLIESYYR